MRVAQEEIRRRVVEDQRAGDAVAHIAVRYHVARSSVYLWRAKYAKTDDFSNRSSSGRPKTKNTKVFRACLVRMLKAYS